MSDPGLDTEQVVETPADTNMNAALLADWEKPTLEDVSEQVMAQPYIRFT